MGYPPAYYPPPAPRRGVSTGATVAIAVTCGFFGMVGGCAVGIVAADDTSSATPEAAVTRTRTVTPGKATETAAGPAAAKPTRTRKPRPTIPGDGTFRVPQKVKPGTYRTAGADGFNCYWARLRNLSGELEGVLANGNVTGPTTVTVRRTDKGFETKGCHTWRKVS